MLQSIVYKNVFYMYFIKLYSKNITDLYLYISISTDKESSFIVYSVMKFSTSFLLQSMHKDWYICQGTEKKLHTPTTVGLDFYNGQPDVLERCTFSFQPTAQYDNKYKNCKNVVRPVVHPAINGQSLPRPPHLVPKKPSPLVPAQPTCIPVCPAGTVGGTPGTQAASGSTIPSLPLEPSMARSESIIISLVSKMYSAGFV